MIDTLQSLRFIFVMMIFMSHFSYHGMSAFDAGGDCGVAFFFMLSGFACSLGYGQQLREGTFCYSHFIRRRLRKLYPLHLLCLLACVLVSHLPLNLKVLLNLLLLQSWARRRLVFLVQQRLVVLVKPDVLLSALSFGLSAFVEIFVAGDSCDLCCSIFADTLRTCKCRALCVSCGAVC